MIDTVDETTTDTRGARHDLRSRYWGHSVELLHRNEDGSWRACIFLSTEIKDGDAVLLQSQRPGVTLRYRVVGEVCRPMDPGDQHFATLVFEGDE